MNTVTNLLSRNGTYTLLYEKDRDYGWFEIYCREKDKHRKDTHDCVNKTLEAREDLLFIAASRTDMTKDILTREIPDADEFEGEKYLIREKNTLRFANNNEYHYLRKHERDDGTIRSRDGKHIMENSYGRMAMANYRAIQRYDELKGFFFSIFNFELKSKKEDKVTIDFYGFGSNSIRSKVYDQYYEVTVKKKERFESILLKKIFEILQVYNSSTRNNKIDGSIPLKLNLTVGGRRVSFLLSQWFVSSDVKDYQLMVSIPFKGNKYKGNAFSYTIGGVGYGDKPYGIIALSRNTQSKIAQDILECLNSPMNSKVNKTGKGLDSWGALKEERLHKLIELIVLTQVIESNIMRRAQDCSRTPGMNKLARKIFKDIADKKATFAEAFHVNHTDENFSYPPIGGGGTACARNAVKNVTKVGVQCHDMSSDSDSD